MLAKLNGTALRPGVSKNKRLYNESNIGRAVARMQARLADPDGRPIVMRTHHDAGDDTTKIVGHVTSVKLDEQGHVKYEAVLNGTQAAKDVLAATEDPDNPGNVSLRNVSIYGWWAERPKSVRVNGEMVETADDLEIDAIDFTAFPGVEGARIDTVTPAGGKSRESAPGRHVITESVDAQVSFVDEAAQPMGKRTTGLKGPGGPYADPGYQKDKKPRYQLDTKKRAKAAWSYINQKDNAAKYNATQVKAIKGRIKAALKKFGVDVTKESVMYADMLGETTIGEAMGIDDDRGAGFSITANNGPICVNISAWDGIDPAELEVIAQAAMQAACDALKALDPDMDADIDVDGAPNADTDGDGGGGESRDDNMESALPSVTATPKDMAAFLARKRQAAESQTPAPTEAGPTVKESAVTDQQQAAETAATTETAAEKPLTATDLTAALTEAFKPIGEAFQTLAAHIQTPAAAPAPAATTETQTDRDAAPTAESAPAATTTESTPKVDVASEAQKAVQDAIRESIPQILDSYGLPRRKGLVRTAESAEQAQTPEQLWANRGQVWDSILPGGTPAAPIPPVTPSGD